MVESEGEGEFEDLWRELLSRKYSYKTVKAYTYFTRDFLNFIRKNHSEIIEVYTHVSTRQIGKFNSPLDNLDLKQKQRDKTLRTLFKTKVQLEGGISEPSSSIPPFLEG